MSKVARTQRTRSEGPRSVLPGCMRPARTARRSWKKSTLMAWQCADMHLEGGDAIIKRNLVHSLNANSEKRSQTQIKGTSFGFLEDGRKLNYV